jgi:dihydroflavonol-4-reductase
MNNSTTFWHGKSVCVTGGSGFLGSHLIRQLLSVGCQVRSIGFKPPHSKNPLFDHPDVQWFWGDLRDESLLKQAVSGCETIFHAAGFVTVWSRQEPMMRDSHFEGTKVLLKTIDPASTLIHTSSIVTLSGDHRALIHDETNPTSRKHQLAYVQIKQLTDQLIRDSQIRYRIVHPGYLVGPEDYGLSVMGKFCIKYWNRRIPFTMPGGLNLVDVRDVAIGELLVAEKGQDGCNYILGGENHEYPTFQRMLAQVAGMKPYGRFLMPWPLFAMLALAGEVRGKFKNKEPYPCWGHARLNRVCWFVNSDKAKLELGYNPRPIAESLADLYSWCREQRLLRGSK